MGALQMKFFEPTNDPIEQLIRMIFVFFYTGATVYLIRLYLNFAYALEHGFWAY